MGIVDENSRMRKIVGENTVVFNIWALFCKKRKKSAFLLKSVTNLLSWKIDGMQGTFLSFNIVFITTNNILELWFWSIIFWDIFIVFAFTALRGFIYQVLQYFNFGCWHITFIFQIKLINFVFFLNHCFHFVIFPRRLPIVQDFGFIGKNPAGNCMFKVNNRNSRTRCEVCSKLTIKVAERRQWRRKMCRLENLS